MKTHPELVIKRTALLPVL